MQKKQVKEKQLRFGQIIRIHGHKCLPTEEKEPGGMITVKGFTDKDAKYTTFQQFKDCFFYRQSLFQILPRGYFETAGTPEQRSQRIKDYRQLVEVKMGQYVKFGEDVVFQHVDSHDYLSGSVRCSDGGLGAFKVELGTDLTPDLVFKLQPFRSFEKEGDKIQLQSPLRIKNISNRCYISTETKQGKHNIVTTYSRSFTWLIHLHEKHETLSDIVQIRTHDLLFLIHTKNEGYLTLQEKGNPCIKLPQYQTGYPFFTSLWQIEKLPVPKISPLRANQIRGTEGTYSLRQVLNDEYLEVVNLSGQKIMEEIDTHEITIKSAKGLPNIEDYLKDKGLIKIGGPKALNEGEIDAGSQIKPEIKQKYQKNYPFISHSIILSQSESQHGFRVMKIDEESKNEVLFILSTFQVLQNFDYQLSKSSKSLELFQQDMSSRELLHIDQTLQKLIAFIKNCSINQIEAQLLPVKKLQYICMDLKICKILFSILYQIGILILKQIYKNRKGENDALKTVFNRAYYFILQIIKGNSITKIYVCQDWLDIILDHALQLQEDTVHICLNQILQNNDEVVTEFLSQDNNKLVQRINTIFTLKPPHQKFLKIFSASCISGNLPIVGNQTLILKEFLRHLEPDAGFVFRYQLQHSIGQGLEQDNFRPKIKYVKIDCHISKDWPAARRLKQFFVESGRIDLYQTSNYFIAYLNLLADICYGKNTSGKNFVEEVLRPRRIEEGDDEPPLIGQEIQIKDILVAILQDDQLMSSQIVGSINLQRAVLRLITFAYIQSSSQSPVSRINRFRNLDQMQGDVMGGKVEFINIMKFISTEISVFKSFYGGQQGKESQSLQIKMRLYTILDLLKSTLINAFWTIQQQQNQILPVLLNILKNNKSDILHQRDDILDDREALRREFALFKHEVSMPTPSVEKIKQCKALACELIEIIFDYRFNNLVTESVKFYKDMEEERDENLRELHKISLNLAQLKSDAKCQILYNALLWQEKMGKILNKEDPKFDNLKKAISQLIPLMVELSIHKDSRLFFRSLLILKRHFYLTSDIKNQLLSLSLFDKHNGSFLANKINDNRKLFSKLQEQSQLYRKDRNPYGQLMDFLAWLSECIKVGTQLQVPVIAINYSSIFDHFNEQSRIDKFHQRLIKNTDLHPLLLRFLDLSKQPLHQFSPYAKRVLKYVYRFLTLLVRNFQQAKKEIIHMVEKVKTHAIEQGQTIKQIYKNRDTNDFQYLAATNSIVLGIEDPNVLHFLQQRRDCEAILFLSELFNDNRDILYNQTQMEQTTNKLSVLINEVPIMDYYKSHILDFLRSLIYFKDKHISVNQGRILAKLQDSKKKNIHYRFDMTQLNGLPNGHSIFDLIEEWVNQNKELQKIAIPQQPWPLTQSQQKPVIILQELTYFITLMNLFSNLVEGRQEVNIGKCRQVHSYSTLMQILKSGGLCYPLKTHLRSYVNELYYSTQIQEDLCVQIINLQLPLLIEDLNTLIVILTKQRSGSYYILHPIRYKYYESYIYLYIQQIAYSMNYLITDATFQREIRKQLDLQYGRYKYYLHYFVLRIYERLRWILNYYYGHKYLRGFLNKITNKMKDLFLLYFKDNALNVFDKSEEKLHPPPTILHDQQDQHHNKKKAMSQNRVIALKKRSKKLLHKLVQAEIQNYFTEDRPEKDKNFPLTFFLPYDQDEQTSQKQVTSNEKQQHERKIAQKLRMMLFSRDSTKKRVDYHSLKLSKLSKQLHEKDSFIIFMNGFIEKACMQLYEVDNFSSNYYKFSQNFVSFQQYIRIFVEVNTNSPSQIPTDLKIFFFNTLLQFIIKHKTGENKLKPIQKWDKYDIEDVKKEIKSAQRFLADSNVAELLIETLKNTTDLNLILSILLFGIAYLIGGNNQCQNSILIRVKQDKKNELFSKLQKIISKLGKKISSKIAEITSTIIPRSDQFVVQSLDRYDYYDKSTHSLRRFANFQEEKDEADEQSLEKRVFGCLFKFMQLLCECNNIQFKNFIRQQVDTNGQKKNYSINILSMTTFEIRRLFKVMNQDASKIILPLTDFLNQVVALPCSLNQLALCETTFFEDLCYMATFFTDASNLKERGFVKTQSLETLFDLYQKCILIVLNILEGNNPQLNKAFLNKLQVQFLLRIIRKNFELLKIGNEMDLKKLLYEKKGQQKHVPLGLQNAINVMIVLLKLQESQGSQAFKQKKRFCLIEIERNGFPLKQLLNCLQAEILKIEIVSTLGKQILYFPKHPILTKLSDATRNRIMLQVSRSTQREKIKSLLKFKQQIFTEIQHNYTIQKQTYLGMDISPAKIQQLEDQMFYMSYLIIAVWFMTTDVIVEFQEVQYMTPRYLSPLLMIFDFVQLGITVLYFILYYKCKFALANYRAKKQKDQLAAEEERLLQMKRNNGAPKNQSNKPSKLKQIGQSIVNNVMDSSLMILTRFDQKFLNVLFYIIASFFGTCYDQKIFLLYILFYFMKNQKLENVFKAITYNLNSLFSVGILGLVFVYIFCLIFYETYALDLAAQSDPKTSCYTIYDCILDLYVSGSIGGSVQKLQPMRFGTDLIYFIFFELLFSNIVSGIMIDTFAELRQKRQDMSDDKKNKCYICGNSRGDLQKNNQKFDDHIRTKHFLWNYIYYLYCLYKKNETEYTGLEYEIRVCVDKGENEEDYIKWIPFGGDEADPDVEKTQQLIKLTSNLNITTKEKLRRMEMVSGSKSEQTQQS